MAKLIITLRRTAGRTQIHIGYECDDDAVRVERERPAQEPVVG